MILQLIIFQKSKTQWKEKCDSSMIIESKSWVVAKVDCLVVWGWRILNNDIPLRIRGRKFEKLRRSIWRHNKLFTSNAHWFDIENMFIKSILLLMISKTNLRLLFLYDFYRLLLPLHSMLLQVSQVGHLIFFSSFFQRVFFYYIWCKVFYKE